jgi:hypothetical protein
MRVFGEQERLPLPERCFICETHPQREAGVLLVDTGLNFQPTAPNPLKGRKILCSRCVSEAANLLGFRTSEEVDEARDTLEAARRFLQPIQNTVQSLAKDIESRTEKLFNLPGFDSTETSPVVKEQKAKENAEDESA